jgi:hypothetical protein
MELEGSSEEQSFHYLNSIICYRRAIVSFPTDGKVLCDICLVLASFDHIESSAVIVTSGFFWIAVPLFVDCLHRRSAEGRLVVGCVG